MGVNAGITPDKIAIYRIRDIERKEKEKKREKD